MKRHLTNFTQSFKFPKQFWLAGLIDLVTFGLLTVIWTLFGTIMTAKILGITKGQPVDQLKTTLLTSSPEAVAAMSNDLRSFFFLLLFGLIALTIITVLAIGYSRVKLWNTIVKKKMKSSLLFRWAGLLLALVLLFVVYGIIIVIIRLLVGAIAFAFGTASGPVIENLINTFFFTSFLVFVFTVFYCFSQKNNIWSSIGSGFGLIKKKFSKLAIGYILMLVVGVILNLVFTSATLQGFLFRFSSWIAVVVSLVVALLYLTWMRQYTVQLLNEK